MKSTQTFAMILMLTATAGLANAQATTSSDDQDLLRGPAVTDNSSSDSKKSDALQEIDVEKELEERPMQLSELIIAIRTLSSNNAGNLLKLPEDQQAKIKEIQNTQRKEFAEYREENYTQFRTLRDQVNKEANERRERKKKEAEQADQKDAMQDSIQGDEEGKEAKKSSEPKAGEAAKKLREMVENAPPTLKAKEGIRDVLSEAQFEQVQERVVKNRMRQKENQERRMKGMRDRDTAKRGADGKDVKPGQRRGDEQGKSGDNSDG